MGIESRPPHTDRSRGGNRGHAAPRGGTPQTPETHGSAVTPGRGDRVATIVLWAISSLLTAWGLFLSYMSAVLGIDWQQRNQSGPAALILGIAIGVLALALFITSIRWSLKRMRRGDPGWTPALLCLAGLFALPLLLSVAPLLEG